MEARPASDAMRPSDSVSASPPPARAARDAMRPSGPARTPTPWPVRRDGWWWRHRRNRAYVLFGLASIAVLIEAVVILGALWSLGGGEASWDGYVAALRTPPLRAFHLAALPVFIWYGGRFLRLFPKTQPPRIEIRFLPEAWRRRPPLALIARVTFLGWALGSVLILALLGGWLP